MRPVSTDTAGSTSRRQADGLEVVQPVRGIGEIADLDRGAQRVLQREPLQFERQRAERALDGAEGSRASGHLPWRASASARHSGASF